MAEQTGITATFSGPVFNGLAAVEIKAACEKVEEVVADRAHEELGELFRQNFQTSTGYYESRVVVKKEEMGHAVTDEGVVYGPWLEGTSSRNGTTRFKGYANFRKVQAKVDKEAFGIASVIIAEVSARL